MAAIANLTAVLKLQTKGFKQGADVAVRSSNRMTGAMKLTRGEMRRLQTASRALTRSMDRLRLVGFIALTAAAGLAAKAFLDFEKGAASVSKTTGLAGQELQDFSKRVLLLSHDLTQSVDELLGIAAAAAQVGVTGTDNLLAFTETTAKLETATDLAGETAVFALARISNATKTAFIDVGRLGSAATALGNSFAATEGQIVTVAVDLSNATRGFGVAIQQVLAVSTTLAAAGVQSRIAASSVRRVFTDLTIAASEGGPQLEAFARYMGLTASAARELIRTNAGGAFDKLVKGLSTTEELTAALAELNLDEEGVSRVLRVLAVGFDETARATETANEAYKENIALNKESEIFLDTTSSKLEILKNRFLAIAIAVLEHAEPAIRALVDAMLEFLSPRNIQKVAALTAQFAALAGKAAALAAVWAAWGLGTAAAARAGVTLGGWLTALALALSRMKQVGRIAGKVVGVFGSVAAATSKITASLSGAAIVVEALKLALRPLAAPILAISVLFQDWGDKIEKTVNFLKIMALRFEQLKIIGKSVFDGLLNPFGDYGDKGEFKKVRAQLDEYQRKIFAVGVESKKLGVTIPPYLKRGEVPVDPEAAGKVASAAASSSELQGLYAAGQEAIRSAQRVHAYFREREREAEAAQKRKFAWDLRVTRLTIDLGKAKKKALEDEEALQKRLIKLEEQRQIRSDAFTRRWQEGIEAASDSLQRQRAVWEQNVEAPVKRVAKTIEDGIVDGLKGAASAAEALGSILNQVLDELLRKLVARPIADFLGTLALQLIGGFSGSVAGPAPAHGGSVYAIPGRASGGPVAAGSPYMVGERGPELFVPQSSGRIVPNGGGGTVVNNYIQGVQDPTIVRNELKRAMPEIIRAVRNDSTSRQRRPGRERRQLGGN